MYKFGVPRIFKSMYMEASRHSAEILTGIGIAGMITSTVLAVHATPKALVLIEDRKRERNCDKLPPVETVKTVWTCYISTALTSIASVACLVGASSVNHRRNAALAMAYTLSESTLKEYRDKVIENIGERKETTIKDAVARDKIEQNPVSQNHVILTNKGDTLCYDAVSGRYFKSDIDKLKKAENILNRRLVEEMSISLNDFYYEIDLPEIDIGDDLGWNIDKGYIELMFSAQLAEDGTPCLVVGFQVTPKWGY